MSIKNIHVKNEFTNLREYDLQIRIHVFWH